MKKATILRVALLGLVAVLLASCYAPLRNQTASLSLNVKSVNFSGNQVVLLLIDDSFQASLAETLWLVNNGYHNGLSTSQADRLTTLAKEIATNGLVNFGGFPFYQLTLSGTSGDITIPGIPADRSYLVKLFVFPSNYSFDPKNMDQHFLDNVSAQNIVFSPGESWTVPFANWTVAANQILNVKAGETASVDVTSNWVTTVP